MNNFIKNNKQSFFLLLGLLLHSSLPAFTLNNQPLDSIIQPGEALLLTLPKENSVAVLEMKNDNLTVKFVNLDISTMLIKEAFNKCSDKHSRPIKLKSDVISNVVSYKGSHLIGKQLNFQSKKLLNFTDCLLESPSISISGNRMFFKDCFLINPQNLFLFIDSLKSNYQIIKIEFYDEPNIPTILTGSVDFLKLNKEPQTLVLSNVKEITIEFNPQVWNE